MGRLRRLDRVGGASTNWLPAGCGARVVEEVYGQDWVGPRVAGSSHFPPPAGGPSGSTDGWLISGGPGPSAATPLWAPFTNLGCIADDGDGPYLVGVQVPLDQLRFLDDWNVAGMRATGSVSIELPSDELFVPDYRGVDFRDVTAGQHRQRPGRLAVEGAVAGLGLQPDGRHVHRHRPGRPRPVPRALRRSPDPRHHVQEPARGAADPPDAHRGAQQDPVGDPDGPGQRRRRPTASAQLAAAGTPADPEYMQHFSARVLAETAYAAKWCAEAIELLQRNSGSTAIMDFEPIQRSWRDARVITLHGALNLEALSENYGRLMAGIQPHGSPASPRSTGSPRRPWRRPADPDSPASLGIAADQPRTGSSTAMQTVATHAPSRGPGGTPIAAIIDEPGAEPRLGHCQARRRASRIPRCSRWSRHRSTRWTCSSPRETFHSGRHDGPYVPGSECVGRVLDSDRYGPRNLGLRRVSRLAEHAGGAGGSRSLVADEDLAATPGDRRPVTGGGSRKFGRRGVPPTGGVMGRLRAGETVLVLGATGAVGQLAIQVAPASRARAGSSARVATRLHSSACATLGADAIVRLRAGQDRRSWLLDCSLPAGPVDVILDAVYGLRCRPRSGSALLGAGSSMSATSQA